MRFTVRKTTNPSATRKLGYAVVSLSFVLGGSAALGWQSSATKLRTARVEEVQPPTPVEKAVEKVLEKPATQPMAKPVEKSAATVTAEPTPNTIAAPKATAPKVAAPKVTATPRPKPTAPANQPRVATKPKSNSLLPFPLPNFGFGDKSEKQPTESPPTARGTVPQRFNPSAASKALGNAPARKPAPVKVTPEVVEPQPDPLLAQDELKPTPARREPKVAARPAPAIVKETPAAEPAPPPPAEPTPAPEMKPAPIVDAAPVVPAPVEPAAPQREVTRPRIAAIPHHLAALEYTPHKNVRPAGFQEVTPGQSKLSSIAEHLGEPVSTEHQGDSTVMTYQVGPFPKVEVILAGDLVDSVVIHLKDAAPEDDVLTELGLANFTPVAVTDDEGNLLGKAIPERGVALSYAGDAADGRVAQVVLATITAEPFLMRALATHDNRYASILADAEYAFTLDNRSAEAKAVTARVLAALGRVSEARAAVEDAIQLDPGATDYRLMYAKLLGQSGDFTNALKLVETISGTASVPPEFVAQAEQQWGDLLANGPAHDYAAAIEHYTKAIKLAAPLSQSEDIVLRRAALRTLVDANLAVASAVAAGNYKRKPEVVPKWISKAEAFGQLALQDGTDPYLRLYVPAKTLAAYAKLEEPIDPTTTVETAITAAQELIAAATDPLYKHQLEWELGCALLDAVQIEHNRGQFELAVQYANNALVLMGDNAAQREATPQRDYQLGKLFFATGALYAIGYSDHAEAVHYYLEALPLLSLPLAAEFKADASSHGERFVSMGVSFWQNGNKEQAIELTLTGVKHLREGIEKGTAEQQALAVPYGNLAAMYRQIGNAGEAKKYTELARRLEPPANTTRR